MASFNEAAGIPRGRRSEPVSCLYPLMASMRPRVFPAEDARSGSPSRKDSECFNEAAGIPRGRPERDAGTEDGVRGFNEAAGIPRGRLHGQGPGGPGAVHASMRPRVFPAED